MHAISLEDIHGKWKCPECREVVYHSYTAMVEVGNPICSECDADMELISTEIFVHN